MVINRHFKSGKCFDPQRIFPIKLSDCCHMKMDYFKILLIFMIALPAQVFADISLGDGGYISQGVPNSEITLSAEERAFLNSHDLRCAMSPNWAPINMYDQNKQLVGIAFDYWELISKHLNINVDCDVKESFSEVLQAIETRDTDFMLATSMTDDRKRYAEFSKAYVSFPIAIATTVDTDYMADESVLIGKRVAVGKGYSAYQILKENSPGIEFVEVANTGVGMELLAANKVFAVVDNLPVLQQLIKQSKHNNIKIAGTARHHIDLRLMVRSDYPQLAVIFNKAIDLISEQEHKIILSRWLDHSIYDQSIVFTPAEQAWLRQDHKVRVRTINLPPYVIVEGRQTPQGISIEYLKLIGQRTGINFQYEVTEQPFHEFLDSIRQRQGIDLTPIIVATEERETYLSFSGSYVSSPYVIFAREQDELIQDISGMDGKTLALPRSFAVQQRIAEDYPGIVQALFDSDEQALQAVATGKVDAYIGNLTIASHIIHRRGFSTLRVIASIPYDDQLLSMANRSDWPELTSIINKALATITEAEKTAMRRKYVAVNYVAPGISSADVFKYIVVVAVSTLSIVLLFVMWNRTLKKRIRERTRSIEKEINNRKKAQEMLEESELRFRATFEQAAVGVALVGSDGHLLRLNQKFCDITGYSKEEMQALTFQDMTYPEDLDKDLEYLRELLDGKKNTYAMEKRYICKDSSIVWINLTVSAVRKENGEVNWFVSIVEDISQRKLAEEALRQSRDYLQFLTDSMADAVFSIKLPERTIEWFNDSYQVLGYTHDECIGESTENFYSDPDAYQMLGVLLDAAIKSDQQVLSFEAMLRRSNGEIIPAEVRSTIYREQGKAVSVTSVVRDVTERYQAEELLKDSEEKFRSLVEQSPVSIQIHALDGRLIQTNAAFARLYALNEEALAELYEKYNVLQDEQARSLGLMPYIEQTFSGEVVVIPPYEYDAVDTLKTLDVNHPVSRKCWVQTGGYAVKGKDGKIISVVFHSIDITERMQAEQALLEYQRRLKSLSAEVVRTEDRERRKIATELHDHVGQSLAAMRIQLATAIRESDGRKLESILQEVSNLLLQAVKDTRNIITDLSPPTLTELGLSAAIGEFLKDQIEFLYGLQVQFNEDAEPTLLNDETKAILYRSVRELLMNVVKHASAHSVSVSISHDQDFLQIVVEDDGIGQMNGQVPKRKISEDGFGLFSIDERMKDIDGSLTLEQDSGKGVKATLIIPLDNNYKNG